MALYSYSEQQIERMIERSRHWRTGLVASSAVALVASSLLLIYRPQLPIFRQPLRDWFIAILFAGCVHPLVKLIRKRNRWQDGPSTALRHFGIEITSDAVALYGESGIVRQLKLQDINRMEEPSIGRGLYLRTSNRYRWLLIPRNLDGYDALKNQLVLAGIPLTPSSFLPNWEEFVFVLLFVSTLLCAGIAHSKTVLAINLLIAVLISTAGLAIVNANRDIPKIRNARIGCFIPVVAAALGFLFR